jgi:hypothetical protein
MKRVYIPSNPYFFRLIIAAAIIFIIFTVCIAVIFPDTLLPPALSHNTPNPAKSAWFLLWIEELVAYNIYLVYIPFTLFVFFLFLPFFVKRKEEYAAWRDKRYMVVKLVSTATLIFIVTLSIIAFFFRSENWSLRIGGRDKLHDKIEDSILTHNKNADSIIAELHCRRCHIINGRGNLLASDLGATSGRLTVTDIADKIASPALQMPRFLLSEEERLALAVLLLSYADKDMEKPAIVEIVPLEGKEKTIFNDKCGGCHLLLSKYGALGRKSAATHISGLFTEYYPPPPTAARWNIEIFKRWLTNPRSIKSNAVMPPVILTEEEMEEIARLIGLI